MTMPQAAESYATLLTVAEKARFLAAVPICEPDECWEWTGTRHPRGYGVFSICRAGKQTFHRAHRVSWELARDPIPKGLTICAAIVRALTLSTLSQ
jgi:hypothetical protein